MRTPLYDQYKDRLTGLADNLRFRRRMVEYGSVSESNASEIREMCAADPLFYLNVFAYTYDPRTKARAIPFITYPYQNELVKNILEAVRDGEDFAVPKSRDMGVSWITLSTIEWMWHFQKHVAALLLSRKEDLVDKRGDPGSLFWKIEFILNHCPGWLQPGTHRNKLHLENTDTESSIDGESTTGDAGRGGRFTLALLDEFAFVDDDYNVLKATADSTPTRLFVSTPNGQNAFHEVVHKRAKRVQWLYWWLHPEKAKGLYTSTNGRLEIIDKDYKFPANYQFLLDAKKRSVWYDKECERRISSQEIAQELDIDFIGSGASYFDLTQIDSVMRQYAHNPFLVGELDVDSYAAKPNGFIEGKVGRLQLWAHPDAQGNMHTDRAYYIGCDISSGTGASNSVAVVADGKTGEKVAELVTPNLRPDEFAVYCVGLARWFAGNTGGALLGWESAGPGRPFGDRVIEMGYRRIYWQKDERKVSEQRPSDIPGWTPTRESKNSLLSAYRSAILKGEFVERSKNTLEECKAYIYTANGGVEHKACSQTDDPSGSKTNHGDRVIASALCNWIMRQIKGGVRKEEKIVPVGSLAWRMKMAAAEDAKRRTELVGW